MFSTEAIRELDDWSPRHARERRTDGIDSGWQMRDHLARYHFVQPMCRGRKVLDVVTGTGYGADILRSGGARDVVVAVDRDARGVGYARDGHGAKGIGWMSCDAQALPFKSEFDVVVSFGTIERLSDPLGFVAECRRALKPGGLYIVSTPLNLGGPYVSIHHTIEFSPTELMDILRPHFIDVQLFGQRRELRQVLRPLGNLPERYRDDRLIPGKGSLTLFQLLDRINKVPAHVAAWAAGHSERSRAQIVPLDAPVRPSWLLEPTYHAMLAFCTA